MSYSLECARSFSASDASESDIDHAMNGDRVRGEYIILTSSDGSFIQASGEDDGPYVLEHYNPDDPGNFRAQEQLSKRQVRDALIQFLRNDPTWRLSREWKRADKMRWSPAMICIAVLLGSFAVVKPLQLAFF